MASIKAGVNFTYLMKSGQFSDLTLVCQGEEFKIHRFVACSHSSVIATALKGDFKEAQSGVITVELFDADTVRRMVEYMYTEDYDQGRENSEVATPVAIGTPSTVPSIAPTTTPSNAPSATLNATANGQSSSAIVNTALSTPAPIFTEDTLHHVQVNAIADYYGIQGLALLANQKIQRVYYTSWDPKTFVNSAKAATSISGDKSLHNMMALLAAQKLKELLKSGQLPSLVGDFAALVLTFHAHLLEASQREHNQVTLQQQQAEAQNQQQLAQVQQAQAQAQQQLAHVQQAQAQVQQQLAQSQLAAEQQQNELQAKLQAAEARATRIIENVEKLVDLTCHQEFCRNGSCNQGFTSYIEENDDFAEPTYMLRCSNCRCRHYAN
ncbi:hypothetical protein TGAM01_v205222 [Trichoderma gamsii]|uniref:BTB domain-containing protein n=1 Tax=Trichoderma gamsii TaxID=398673 RepID=A0A2P4ZNB3_9HYPO|nr:hypothetical protein TGAM01_v205222 [Trichoderma gamsii]PON25785.1 hypothetical protein TGAM01_v205222 [Trichoderma gamsii]